MTIPLIDELPDYPDPDSTTFSDNIGPWAAALTTMTSQINDRIAAYNLLTLVDVGDYGLGATTLPLLPSANIDSTSIPSGFYRTAATDTGTFPTSAETGVVMVLPRVTTSSGLYQIFMRGASAQLWVRSYVSSAWGAWSRMVTNAEIAMPQSAVVADDAVTSFTPPWTGGIALVQFSPTSANPDNTRRALFWYDVGSGGAAITGINAGAGAGLMTGVITGSSGTDTAINISAANTGVIMVNNRSGGSGTIGIAFLGMGTLA